MQLTWVKGSTSWFWIVAGGRNIHFDPSYYHDDHARGLEAKERADLILISHSHGDHFQPKNVADLSDQDTKVIAPTKVAKRLAGVPNLTIAVPGEEHDLGWAKVKAVHAYNLGLRGHFMHTRKACVGYLLTVEGKTIYHAGDTDLITEMGSLGHVDIALLPIGGTFTMDVDAAAEAARTIKANVMVPMHNLKTPTAELKNRLAGHPDIQVIIAEHGKPFEPF